MAKINDIHNLLQNLHPKIKFAIEHNFLPFLNIFIKYQNGQIITDIYHKPTDTQQYLHFKSHHQFWNCIKSIPSTLTCRFCTIVTSLGRIIHNLPSKRISYNIIKSGIRISNTTRRTTKHICLNAQQKQRETNCKNFKELRST